MADFEACRFSVAQLSPGVPDEAWFLAWGGSFASNHGTIKVRLYAFEGGSVRTIWKDEDLDAGKVTTTADSVVIDYLDWKNNSIESMAFARSHLIDRAAVISDQEHVMPGSVLQPITTGGYQRIYRS